MRISVAMTMRNATQYLQPLLASLERQTLLPAELVVHDDASEDDSAAVVEAFASRAPFEVRLERAAQRRGHVEGFLRAARLCTGDLVAFCDADDVWLERKLAVCHAALDGSGPTLALHATRVVDAELREIAPPWPAVGPARLVPPLGLSGLAVDAPGMAMVFRRELLDAADPAARPPSRFDNRRPMLHDEWIFFLAGVLGPIQVVADPLLLYRQHGANDTGWFTRDRQTTLEPATHDYRVSADHCAACADYLAATRSEDTAVAARLQAGARHYAAAARNWRLRMELYAAADRRARARLLRRLVATRAYGPKHAGGFGWRGLGKDAIGGVGLRVRSGGPG